MLDLDKIKSFEILSKDEQIEALALIDKWKNIKARTKCRDDFLEFVQDADVSKAVAFTEGTYNPVSQMGSEDVMSKFDAEELDAIQMDSLEEEMARSLDYQVVSSYDALIDIYTQERRS